MIKYIVIILLLLSPAFAYSDVIVGDPAEAPANSVDSLKIVDDSIGNGNIQVNAVSTTEIRDGTVASVDLATQSSIVLTTYSSVGDSSYAGIVTTLLAGYTTKIGDCCYIAADGDLDLTDKDAEGTTGDVAVYIVLESGITDGNAVLCLVEGWMRYDDKYEFAIGKAVFIGDDGLPTTTQSSTTGDFLRIVGHASPDVDIFYFKPDGTWLEIP